VRRPRGCADSAAGARGALRSDRRNSTRQAAVTAARPKAAAAAPPTDVPYTTSTTGTTTQLKAAQRTTSLAESDEGRGAASTRCPCCGAGEGSGAGADGRAGTKAPWRRRGDRGATRSGAFRSLARTSTAGSAAGSTAGSAAGSAAGGGRPTDGRRPPSRRPARWTTGADCCRRQAALPIRGRLGHAPWNAAYGQQLWAGEECRRTLGVWAREDDSRTQLRRDANRRTLP
jgi:hypothetical protein